MPYREDERNRRIGSNILLMIFTIIFTLFIIEIFMRVLPDEFLRRNLSGFDEKGIYVNDDTLGYRVSPNLETLFKGKSLTTDSRGFRKNPTFDTENPDFSLLIIGDSYAFGEGVDDKNNFPAILGNIYKDRYKELSVKVVNAGVPGFGNDQELKLLAGTCDEINPDMVVLTVYTGNDFADNKIGGVKRRRVASNGFLYDRYLESKFSHILRENFLKYCLYKSANFLEKKSLLFFFLKNRLLYLASARFKWEPLNPYYFLDEISLGLMRKNLSADDESLFKKTVALAEKMNAISQKCGARFLVLILPAGFQVYEDVFKGLIGKYNYKRVEFAPGQINSMFAESMKKSNIDAIDLLPGLREQKEFRLYRWGHLNERGNGIVAQKLFEFIENNKTVPR